MHVERLRILQQHLVRLSRTPIAKRPRTFNMLKWFSRARADCNEFCGTAACALGEAGLIPELRAQGLKTNRRTRDVEFYDSSSMVIVKNEPAAGAFFDISQAQVSHLFHPWNYPIVEHGRTDKANERLSRRITPLAVAKRIEELVQNNAVFSG